MAEEKKALKNAKVSRKQLSPFGAANKSRQKNIPLGVVEVPDSNLITRDAHTGNHLVKLPTRGRTIVVSSLPSARVLAEAETVRATVASRSHG